MATVSQQTTLQKTKLKHLSRKSKTHDSRKTSLQQQNRTRAAGDTGAAASMASGYLNATDQTLQKVQRGTDHRPLENAVVNGGQDIRFIDVSSQEKTSNEPRKKLDSEGLTLYTPKEILELSQEANYEAVYEVDLHASNLTTVPSLEKFTSLRLLDLSCNSIKQISNLHKNKGLKELKLYGNEISTISSLESLAELHTLQLQHNRIQNVGQCLSCLKKLNVLRLDSNRLKKIDSRDIASCSQLTFVDISSNNIDSLTSLNCLSSLEELHATHNGLKAVTDLTRCKKLNEVNLSFNCLTDVSGLKGLPHITVLHLANNCLTSNSMKALGRLRSLQNLDVSSNHLVDVSCIPELFPSLEVLNVADNRIRKWTAVCSLVKCSSLSEMYLSGNPFCSEDGDKPSYHQDIHEMIPNLEILDGALVKRTSVKSAPIMRPMSAASVLSARQVENQLKSVEQDLASFGASLAARFESLRSTMESLPLDPPSPRPGTALSLRSVSTSDGSIPGSRCNSRNRILDAQVFASQNF